MPNSLSVDLYKPFFVDPKANFICDKCGRRASRSRDPYGHFGKPVTFPCGKKCDGFLVEQKQTLKRKRP